MVGWWLFANSKNLYISILSIFHKEYIYRRHISSSLVVHIAAVYQTLVARLSDLAWGSEFSVNSISIYDFPAGAVTLGNSLYILDHLSLRFSSD